MTSMAICRASWTATAVLPTPVGPTRTSSGGRPTTCAPAPVLCRATALATEPALPRAPELPFYVAQRQAADDRPAVWAEVRRFRDGQIRDEPRHLLALQRGVRLDGRVAGHEGQRAVQQRLRLAFAGAVDVLHERLDEPPRLLPPEQRGHRAQDDGGAAPALESEAQALERLRPLLDQRRLARAELQGLREEQLLRGQRARVQIGEQPLEQHALVRHVLIQKKDLVVRCRYHERVLELADDVAEVCGCELCRGLVEESGLGVRRGHVSRKPLYQMRGPRNCPRTPPVGGLSFRRSQ